MSLQSGSRLLSRGRTAIAQRVGVDVRALAALRVSLALVLLADLLLRSRNLVAFYTDAGTLPRSLLAASYPAFATYSLHALSGDAWLQVALFVVAGLLALSLLVGYRTKTTLFLSWLLLVSLHARNPYVLNGGDSLLRRLLFWGLFLPLGRRWSVDALRRGSVESVTVVTDRVPEPLVASVASAALLVQVVLVYATNAVVKLRGDVWLDGTAILQVFSLDQLTVFLGDILANYPTLLRVFGELWLLMVVTSPLLVLLTGRTRAGFAALFVGMHLGMLATMKLGIFPLVSVCGLLAFLPPVVWEPVERRVVDPVRRRTRVARTGRTVDDLLPTMAFGGGARWTTLSDRVAPAVVSVLLVVVLLWNAASIGVVDTPEVVESNVDPGQFRWNMFAPAPLNVDGWFVVPGRLDSGERVDAFRGSDVDWEKPDEVDRTYPSARWRKYLQDVRWGGDTRLRRGFADYLCHRWNSDHEDELTSLTVGYVQQPTRLDGPEPTKRVELLEHQCPAGT
ncbi:Vitamin K-dependent gamma-carboxylase [Halogranum amylolyticum]|uniref:Vitamin K-dependent gamma-carboxylase n=1 Tax=Halogranum amylolyticum TaxID=660520 RepID=A0A1H8NGL4_9EURY|nr:HTTM domain-containing protein [Halogranum amylolyticum]SEO28672.1 Vitamin K-dependent gamma-carboxylase [Halogranum amylolyticum]